MPKSVKPERKKAREMEGINMSNTLLRWFDIAPGRYMHRVRKYYIALKRSGWKLGRIVSEEDRIDYLMLGALLEDLETLMHDVDRVNGIVNNNMECHE